MAYLQNALLVIDLKELAGKVFETLKQGYSEAIYQRALSVELKRANIFHETEVVIEYDYQGVTIGNGRADIIIYTPDKKIIVVELKAKETSLKMPDIQQVVIYKEHLRKRFQIYKGVLINFPQKLGCKQEIEFIEIPEVNVSLDGTQ
jgi:GxxExxY protein